MWSFMRQFSTITKEMSVDKRVDALTDAAIYYGEHLVVKYGNKWDAINVNKLLYIILIVLLLSSCTHALIKIVKNYNRGNIVYILGPLLKAKYERAASLLCTIDQEMASLLINLSSKCNEMYKNIHGQTLNLYLLACIILFSFR